MADVLVDVEQSRSLVEHAAWVHDHGGDDPALVTLLARLHSASTLQRAARTSVQVHGGIGSCVDQAFTDYLAGLGVESDFPEGWYFSGPSYSPLLPTDGGGVNTYLQAVKDFAPDLKNFYSPFPQYPFAAVLTASPSSGLRVTTPTPPPLAPLSKPSTART